MKGRKCHSDGWPDFHWGIVRDPSVELGDPDDIFRSIRDRRRPWLKRYRSVPGHSDRIWAGDSDRLEEQN